MIETQKVGGRGKRTLNWSSSWEEKQIFNFFMNSTHFRKLTFKYRGLAGYVTWWKEQWLRNQNKWVLVHTLPCAPQVAWSKLLRLERGGRGRTQLLTSDLGIVLDPYLEWETWIRSWAGECLVRVLPKQLYCN